MFPAQQASPSFRSAFKRLSVMNPIQPIGGINALTPPEFSEMPLTQKYTKSLKQLSSKYLYPSVNKFPSSSHLPRPSTEQNLLQLSQKDIHKLFQLLGSDSHTEQHYQEIDRIFCRGHVAFFENVRGFLTKEQYRELIDKCQLMCYAENKVVSRKGKQDKDYLVLIDGAISFNEEKIVLNTVSGNQEIQYIQMFLAQKGHLLNADTLTSPRHNSYAIITHSTVTAIALPSQETYSRLLKKYFNKQLEEKSYSLSNTSLFKGISPLNIMKLMPEFFYKNFYKFNETIYRQEDKAEFVYWILEGEVELMKEELWEADHSANRRACKIVKLSKHEVFGIDEYVFKQGCKYAFTARVCSESLKTICISYKSLSHIQSSFPCLNENIDFYLKRASAMHNKIVNKNHKIMETKENIRIQPKKKKQKKNKKKKKNPSSLEWWGLAQNTVGNKKYKLQLPKFDHLDPLKSSKTQPMFETTNFRTSKIQQFRRKIFEQDIDEMIEAEQRRISQDKVDQSPYKVDYMPKISKLKVKMLDLKPKAIDQTEKVKKKLLSYAKHVGSFCDKLNLD